MILSREQINRYLRHIIIPEISGQGQKKIIESSVFICADEAKDASYLLYYLAAAGVGNISCFFIDRNGYEKLFNNVRDINDDCKIELADIDALKQKDNLFSQKNVVLSVFLFQKSKIKNVFTNYPEFEAVSRLTPTIFASYDGWKGFIQFFDNPESFINILTEFKELCDFRLQNYNKEEGIVFSKGILGAIGAIEVIKHILNLGTKCEKPLFIDLLSMELIRDGTLKISDFFLSGKSEKYKNEGLKNLKPYNFSKELKDCKVLIVGTGGLGSPSALALAGAGIGTIGLMDYDTVDFSNLNRQILHSTSRIGTPKVESAELFIKSNFNGVDIVKYNTGLTRDNALDIISEYDVIIDAVDNFPTRYLINDACYFAGKPMIEAGAVRFSGLNMTILPGVGTCYRCLFPDIPQSGSVQSCAEVGVLGPVPGVMGFIEAAETVKLLLGRGQLLVNRIMYFDALDLDFDIINVNKSLKCKLCGEEPSITELLEYDFNCKKD